MHCACYAEDFFYIIAHYGTQDEYLATFGAAVAFRRVNNSNLMPSHCQHTFFFNRKMDLFSSSFSYVLKYIIFIYPVSLVIAGPERLILLPDT